VIPFNQNQYPVCGWANLRSRPAIHFNQNQNLCGWANLRSRPAIPFNQNQNLHVVGLTWDPVRGSPLTRTKICVVGLTWDPVRWSLLTRTNILCVLPDGRVWTFFSCFENFPNGKVLLIFLLDDKVWLNFSLDAFFLFMFLQDWHLSFLIARLTFIFPDDWN
jgi:hypothetical protein